MLSRQVGLDEARLMNGKDVRKKRESGHVTPIEDRGTTHFGPVVWILF